MKKVIIKEIYSNIIFLNELDAESPVFAKKAGKLVGMIVLEYPSYSGATRGWILKVGGDCGTYGYFYTREECILGGKSLGYEFFVEDQN